MHTNQTEVDRLYSAGTGVVRDNAHTALERTALKEWGVVVNALARGDFSTMLRKGGIREQRAGFAVRHDQFFLLPTWFHENPDDLAESLRGEQLAQSAASRPDPAIIKLNLLARVRAVWAVTDEALLPQLAGHHGLSQSAVESRFHYRNNPVIHVIAVEVLSLPQAAVLPNVKRYQGCVSWVELDSAIDTSAAEPLTDAQLLSRRVGILTEMLGTPLPPSGSRDVL